MVAPRPNELALALGILEGRFLAPRHLLQGPTRHAEDGEEDLVHTQAEIPVSTIALEAPVLSREESVMARMVELSRPEPKRPVTNFFAAVGNFVLEELLGPVRLYFTPARRVRRRANGLSVWSDLFHRLISLDGPSKVAVLAAPYVLALALAALLLERQHRASSEPIALEPAPAVAAAPIVNTTPPPVSEPTPTEATPTAVAVPGIERQALSLSWATSLRAKPSPKAKKVALVPAGVQLELIVGLDTPSGFVLAREMDSGAVGYLKVSEIYEEPSKKASDRASRADKRRRRAGRR